MNNITVIDYMDYMEREGHKKKHFISFNRYKLHIACVIGYRRKPTKGIFWAKSRQIKT